MAVKLHSKSTQSPPFHPYKPGIPPPYASAHTHTHTHTRCRIPEFTPGLFFSGRAWATAIRSACSSGRTDSAFLVFIGHAVRAIGGARFADGAVVGMAANTANITVTTVNITMA